MSRRIPVDSESTQIVVHTADPWHSQVTNLEPCSILKLMTILITWSVFNICFKAAKLFLPPAQIFICREFLGYSQIPGVCRIFKNNS